MHTLDILKLEGLYRMLNWDFSFFNYRKFGLISLGAVGAFLSFKDFGITSTLRPKEIDEIY